MQFKIHTGIAVALLGGVAFAGNAMATETYNDGSAGNGDAFLAITDGSNSVVDQLAFNYTGASTLASTSWTLSLGSVNPATATFNVFAVNDVGQKGAVTSGVPSNITDLGGGANAVANVQTVADYLQQYVSNGINASCSANPCAAANGTPAFFADQSYGTGATNFSGTVGSTINLYKLVDTSSSVQTVTLLGTLAFAKDASDSNYTLTFTAAGGAPVPLPAAIWLLGSGIAGFGAVSRRRRAAAAAA